MSLIPNRDRRDILAAIQAKHGEMIRAANAAMSINNYATAGKLLERAGKLQAWIAELERPAA